MSLRIEPTAPADQGRLIQFLVSVFHSNPKAPFVDARLMQWKYFEPCHDWTGPRSFVLKQENEIVAHAGIFPVTFLAQNREVRSIHLIDWAASPSVPGAGVLLLRKAASLTDTLLAVGGSVDTRQIMPKLGFKEVANLQVFARVIRPWRQARAAAFKGWRAPLRLSRNLLWSLSPRPSVPKGWSVMLIPRFDESSLPILQGNLAGQFTASKRTPGMLNYMLRCPGASFSAFLITRNGQPLGHFIVSWVGRQCRIADVFLNSGVSADWQFAYALATRMAAADPRTCEVEAVSSIPLATDAILQNGFHLRDHQPIFLSDPKQFLSAAPPLNINLLDGEGSYLNDPASPFLT
jgi:hypothetical protein